MKTQSEPIVYYSGDISSIHQEIILSSEESKHLYKVKRINYPADVYILNPQNLKIKGKFFDIDPKKRVKIEIQEIADENQKAQLIAILPLVKINRLEFAIEKLTEIGVTHFLLYKAEFSNLNSLNFEKKDSRWKNIAISACKQSRNFHLPVFQFFERLSDIFKSYTISNLFIPIELKQQETIFDYCELIDRNGLNAFVIGPEGGFSNSEVDVLKNYHGRFFKILSNILRTETAAIYTAAMLNEMINLKKGMKNYEIY